MNEKQDNYNKNPDDANKKQKKNNNLRLFLYKLFNYASYHAYRKNLKRLEIWFAILFIVGLISCFIPSKIGSTMVTLVFVFLILYSFTYTWIMMKSRRIRLQSQAIMKKIQLEGNTVVKSWNLYDGAYNQDDFVSIELSFVKDNGIINNIYHLFKKDKVTLPPNEKDIQNLKNLLFNLYQNGSQNWLVYGTLNSELVERLAEKDIYVQEMDHKYITKPSYLDYAACSGMNGLWKFNRGWKPYALGLDVEKYKDELIAEQNKVEKERIRETRLAKRKLCKK